ncbi:MAG: group II intron reverse transcriptase/maturase [Candidatus Edwardsbacteria bacterium]
MFWLEVGIPTIRDRVVQQAILNRMEKIFEPKFSEVSYGFRVGRSCHQAIRKIEEHLASGCQWIVEVDMEKFFDTVNHELLIDLVNEEISDGRVLRLIRKFLTSGMMEEMKIEYQTNGTPPGGVISPLLANIYLQPFDEEMTQEGFRVVRYADDIVVLCQSKAESLRAKAKVLEILEGKLRLKVSSEKTKVTHLSSGFEFLGFVFRLSYKYPRFKWQDAFRDKIRFATRRKRPKTMFQIIEEINPIIRGWGNYFACGNCYRIYYALDKWLRRRIQVFKAKRWASDNWRKYPDEVLRNKGLISLVELLKAKPGQLELFPVKGQRLREAEYGKSVCSV